MPQVKFYVPESLEDLCLTAVLRCLETDLLLCEVAKGMASSSLLLRHVDISLAKIANDLTNYLAFLPGTISEMVRQQITKRVLKKYAHSANSTAHSSSAFKTLPLHTMTVRLLEIVLNEDVKSFDLSELQPSTRSALHQPAPGEPWLWELLLSQGCSGLQKISLPSELGKYYQVDLDVFVGSLARQCNQLTEVVLKDAIKNGQQVLAALGAHCPSLKILDIAGSAVCCDDVLYLIFPDFDEPKSAAYNGPKVKKISVAPIVPNNNYSKSKLCNTLKELNVSDTKVKSYGVYYALKYLPHLESLGDCYYVTSGIKKHMLDDCAATFKLKRVCCRALTGDKVKLVSAACPDLETLYLSCGNANLFSYKLSNLRKFNDLRSLTLESMCRLDLTVLRFIHQLVHLKLQVPEVDVGHVAEASPTLQKLIIGAVPKKTFTLSEEHKKLPLFQSLQELQVDCPIPLQPATFIITTATQLRSVQLVRVKRLTDPILSQWLEINPLVHLQTWLLTYSHLTETSVTSLLARCPKLTTIGRLSGWDVRSWESRRLQRTWQGFEINLVLFSSKQDVAQIMDATASSDEEQE